MWSRSIIVSLTVCATLSVTPGLNPISNAKSQLVFDNLSIQFPSKLGLVRALSNLIVEGYSIDKLSKTNCDFALEIGFKPGVTDNVAHTVKETIIDLLHIKEEADLVVYTSKVFLISGTISAEDIKKIAFS